MSFDKRCWSLFKTMLQLSRKSSKKFLDGTFSSGYVVFFWSSSLFKDQIWGHSVDPSFIHWKKTRENVVSCFFSGILVISCRCIYLLTLGKEQQKNAAFRLLPVAFLLDMGQKKGISHAISASTKGQKWSQLMRQKLSGELELDLLRLVGLKSPVISSGPCHSTKTGVKSHHSETHLFSAISRGYNSIENDRRGPPWRFLKFGYTPESLNILNLTITEFEEENSLPTIRSIIPC